MSKYTYKQLNNLLKSQTQIEYLSDSTNFQSDNPSIDFTHFNKNYYIFLYNRPFPNFNKYIKI